MSTSVVTSNKATLELTAGELRALGEVGTLTPGAVLARASDPASPLHRHFTWDDTEAAEKFRLIQAGMLIRRARVTILQGSGETTSVRAFVSLQAERANGGGSRLTESVLASEALTASMLITAKMELAAFRRKYGQLSLLSGVIAAIEALEAELPAH